MAKKPESRRQLRIRRALEKAFPGCFAFKYWVGEFNEAGIPDLHCCISGLAFYFEVKEPDGEVSVLQQYQIRRARRAGACAEVVETPQEALSHVRRHMTAHNARTRGKNT